LGIFGPFRPMRSPWGPQTNILDFVRVVLVVLKIFIYLTKPQTDLLTKGLDFRPTPRQVPTVDYITATEKAAISIGTNTAAAADLRNTINHILKNPKPYTSNLNREEIRALTDLRKIPNITILPADKGRATVVMDTSQYLRKMTPHTTGNPSNLLLPVDPTTEYKEALTKTLQPLSDIDYTLFKQVRPTREVTPRMQGQPKVHKPPDDQGQYPFRPIVSGRDSITQKSPKKATPDTRLVQIVFSQPDQVVWFQFLLPDISQTLQDHMYLSKYHNLCNYSKMVINSI
jgi:hypothetical protein